LYLRTDVGFRLASCRCDTGRLTSAAKPDSRTTPSVEGGLAAFDAALPALTSQLLPASSAALASDMAGLTVREKLPSSSSTEADASQTAQRTKRVTFHPEVRPDNESGEETDDAEAEDEDDFATDIDPPLTASQLRASYLQLSLFARTWGFLAGAVTLETTALVSSPSPSTVLDLTIGTAASTATEYAIPQPELSARYRTFSAAVLKGLARLRPLLGLESVLDSLILDLIHTLRLPSTVANLSPVEVQVLCLVFLHVLMRRHATVERCLRDKAAVVTQLLSDFKITPDHIPEYVRLFEAPGSM